MWRRPLTFPLVLLTSGLALLPACGGHSVTRCAPNTPTAKQECSDVSMPGVDGDVADAWLAKSEALSDDCSRCEFWTQRVPEASPRSGGLLDFAQRMRAAECHKAEAPPVASKPPPPSDKTAASDK